MPWGNKLRRASCFAPCLTFAPSSTLVLKITCWRFSFPHKPTGRSLLWAHSRKTIIWYREKITFPLLKFTFNFRSFGFQQCKRESADVPIAYHPDSHRAWTVNCKDVSGTEAAQDTHSPASNGAGQRRTPNGSSYQLRERLKKNWKEKSSVLELTALPAMPPVRQTWKWPVSPNSFPLFESCVIDNKLHFADIPYFKECIIVATNSDRCGHRTNEDKSGSGIAEKECVLL